MEVAFVLEEVSEKQAERVVQRGVEIVSPLREVRERVVHVRLPETWVEGTMRQRGAMGRRIRERIEGGMWELDGG